MQNSLCPSDNDRKSGEAVDRTLLNHLLKMFTDLGIYSERFEKLLLDRTSELYAAEGVKYMQSLNVPDYLKHVEVRLQEEHDRCPLYLDASTRKLLVATAERQLLQLHISAILEKLMISKFTSECGSQFTNNLSGMCKDIELSKEINESFKQSSQARTDLPSGIEMSVHVLQASYWPTYPPTDVRLPHELNVYQDIFKEFYLSKYRGRKLMWQNALGHCVLKAEFPKGKKELAVSLFQAVVLMLFNDARRLSFEDIKDATSIEDKELRRTLQSLACGKVRVLKKIPKGREVDDNMILSCLMMDLLLLLTA